MIFSIVSVWELIVASALSCQTMQQKTDECISISRVIYRTGKQSVKLVI